MASRTPANTNDHDEEFREGVLDFIQQYLLAFGWGFLAGAMFTVGAAYVLSFYL